MTLQRLMIKSLALAIILLLCPQIMLAQTAVDERDIEEERFQAQTNLFLFERSMEFEAEIVLHEAFLLWLYEGIIRESKKRQKEDLRGTLNALNLLDPTALDDSSYMLPTDLYEAPPRVQYKTWEKLQKDKYIHKYTHARHIKDRLLHDATSLQQDRMFDFDLKTALEVYDEES